MSTFLYRLGQTAFGRPWLFIAGWGAVLAAVVGAVVINGVSVSSEMKIEGTEAQTGEDWARPVSDDSDSSPVFVYSLLLATFLGTMGLPHILVRFYTNPDGPAARRTTVHAPRRERAHRDAAFGFRNGLLHVPPRQQRHREQALAAVGLQFGHRVVVDLHAG